MTDKEKRELKDGVISIFKSFNILDHTATIGGLRNDILRYIDSLQEEPVSNDLKEAADNALESITDQYDIISVGSCLEMFRLGAEWQKTQEYACYEEAFEDGAKWKKEQINEALLSEVLPCFMHGGEADEVVAKLEKVLNQKK